MKNKYMKYIYVFVFGILISISIFNYRDIFEASSTKDIVSILSDGFLLPGVLILGAGLLIMVSNGGVFDIFVYGFSKLRAIKLTGDKKPATHASYYDYKINKEKAPFLFLLIVGSIFFLLSIIFNIAFYYV